MERDGTMFCGWHIPFGHGTPEEKVTVTHRYKAIEAVPTEKKQKKQKKGKQYVVSAINHRWECWA